MHGSSAGDWAVLRRTAPDSKAFWTVKLSCGHVFTHVVTQPGWMPEQGPLLVSEEHAAEMRRAFA